MPATGVPARSAGGADPPMADFSALTPRIGITSLANQNNPNNQVAWNNVIVELLVAVLWQ
jgi:hypothetical protein